MTITDLESEVAKAKAEVYKHHAFTDAWNRAARELWSLEDQLSEARDEQDRLDIERWG